MKRLALSALLLAAPTLAHAQPLSAPTTSRGSQADFYHGVRVDDPYRWLEDANSSATQAWISEQNARTEAELSSYPESAALTKRIGELALTSTRRSSPHLAGSYLIYTRDTPPQAQPVLVAQPWPAGPERVLLDPNQDAHAPAVLDFWPSHTGRYVVVGTAEGGTESITLRVIETATGRVTSDTLPRTAGGTTPAGVLWDPDERGFTYVKLPDPEHPFNAALAHHQLGDSPRQDVPVFGRGLSPVSEWTLTSSESGEEAAALVHYGDGSRDHIFVRQPGSGDWREAMDDAVDARGGGHWLDHELLVVADGNLQAIDPQGRARLVLDGAGTQIEDAAPIRGGMLVTRVAGPRWWIERYNLDGKKLGSVELPDGCSVTGIVSSQSSDRALISYEGWSTPSQWSVYDAEKDTLTALYETSAPADYSHVRVERLDARSGGGVRVPVTLLSLDSTPRDGKRPTILTGYGGFGINTAPRFLGPQLAWLERGGVIAVANLRGGGEFGESWHQAGMLNRKQNVFDDFRAAANALKAEGWTDSDHLGIMGGSNGGLLVGASLTQHPEDYKAAVGLVGLYDMLRAELWPNGRYNVTEFGSVKDPQGFHTLMSYSPLHHVQPGTSYPATLLQTGENDPRVAPWQSRKFAAALQAATTGQKGPVLLLTQRDAGHGQGASFSQRVGKTALAFAFFAHQLGLDAATTTSPK